MAFEGLKELLSNPPILFEPTPGEDLYLYLAVNDCALFSVLVKAKEWVYRPIYYVNHIL